MIIPTPRVELKYLGQDEFVCRVNGRKIMQVCGTDGCRTQFHIKSWKCLLKIDSYDLDVQGWNEVVLWNELDAEDRPYFVPILAWGQIDHMTWVIEPYLNFNKGVRKHNEKAEELAKKYDIADWGWCQYIVFPDETPIIHDYGMIEDGTGSGRRVSKRPLGLVA